MSLADLLALAGDRAIAHAPLGALTTYRVGGSAAALVTLSRQDDLAELGPAIEAAGRPVLVVGNGSNLLVADGELDLVAVRLAGDLAAVEWRDEGGAVVVRAGGGADLPVGARRLAGDGVVGFEWAVGVPGTFGGAVAMNAGGHGSHMAASVTSARTWRGALATRDAADLDFGYRTSAVAPGEIVVSVELALARGDAEAARARVSEVVRWRRAHQPGGTNAGSVFRNPPGDTAGRLIEASGWRGRRLGTARVSEVHANFIQADPGGTAADVAALMAAVADAVREATGVELVRENRLVGFGDGA